MPDTMTSFLPADFDFGDAEPQTMPVKYKGKEYVLREADEAAAVAYRNACSRAARFNDKGRVGQVEGIGEAQPILVAACLFEIVNGVPSPTPVTAQFVKGMLSRVVKKLFTWVQEVSDLNERAETAEEIDREMEDLRRRKEELARGDTAPKDSPNGTTSTFG